MPRFMTKREVAEELGFHPEHVMRMARQGTFPKPIKTGTADNCAVRFVTEEVNAWIALRMIERGTANDQ